MVGNIEMLPRDKREIASIEWPDGGRMLGIGSDGVTAIRAYEEGDYYCTRWLAVFSGEVLMARVPANHVTIYYNNA